MTETLKSCPFCGSEARSHIYQRDGNRVCCTSCGASVGAFHPDANAKAITAWNRRPPSTPDSREAVLPWQTLRNIVTPPPFWHNEQAWTIMARLVVAALTKPPAPEGDEPTGEAGK